MTNAASEWTDAGNFESITAATRRIREIEGYPVTGIFFDIYVDTVGGTDEESFGHLEPKGRQALYVVKRRAH